MIQNDSFQNHNKFKKYNTNEIKRIIIKNKKNNLNQKENISFGRNNNYFKEIKANKIYKNINENYLSENTNNNKSNSNKNSLSKSSNEFLNKKENCSKKKNQGEFTSNDFFKQRDNSKNKNRYLTYFESSGSSKIDESKINILLNDFTISNENLNTENIKMNSNLQKITNYNNKEKLLIKVNKKSNMYTKNFYIETCLKLKEKIEKNFEKEENKKIETESTRRHIFKIPNKSIEKKRNSSINFKKHYKNSFGYLDETNKSINSSRRQVNENKCNSFISSKNILFTKNNNNIKTNQNKYNLFSLNKINKERPKLENNSCLKHKENNNKNKNYEQRKIKVLKYKSKNLMNKTNYKNNLTLSIENIKKNDNIKTNQTKNKNDTIFKTLSFNKTKTNSKNNCHEKNLSLDFSSDNQDNSNLNYLLTPINEGNSNNKTYSSLSKKRQLKNLSKRNIQAIDFDFDELNKKLLKMIKNLESHEKKTKINHKRNEQGFLKWDILEKIIQNKEN